MSDSPIRPAWPLYTGVFFTAMAVLLFQICLTRLFAVTMWHHFAYMVVSLALLGFGASGTLLTFRRAALGKQDLWRPLSLYATASGVSIVASFFVVTSIRVDSLELWREPQNFLALWAIFAVLAIPFWFAGMAIGTALCWRPRQIGKLYFVDLVGSAAGGLSAPWLLSRLPTSVAIGSAALLALVAGVLFARPLAPRRWRLLPVPALAAVAGLTIALAGGGLGIPHLDWKVPFAPHKGFADYFFGADESDRTLPSAIAQVDVSAPLQRGLFMAADFGPAGRAPVELRGVTQDGTAPTALIRNAGAYGDFPGLAASQAATAFVASDRSAPEVLVIGVGGGPDVMMALYFGSRRVVAVEINQAMIDMVTRDYADYIGHLFEDPRIELVKDDGRAFLKHRDDRFDVIQLSGVDTYTALATGAYTLSESYLYTVEALQDMYQRLRPGGMINYSRLVLTTLPRRPRETIRLASMARTALEELGVAEPERHIAVLQGGHWASTLIRKEPFQPDEIAALRQFAGAQGFFGLLYDPLRRPRDPFEDGEEVLIAQALRNLVPADLRRDVGSDERASLAEALRLALAGDQARAEALLSSAGRSVAQGTTVQVADVESSLRRRLDAAVEFVQAHKAHRVAMQGDFETLMRGAPAERRRLITDYVYDLRPARDDWPFFFNYFKMSRLLEASTDVEWFEALPEFPVGHMVLWSSLVQILLLAAVLILLPLRWLRRSQRVLPSRGRVFAYFAALGVGFMLIEISLMQKFVLFLGHPTASLSVVLSGLLAFSGLGALLSTRVREIDRKVLRGLVIMVTLVVLTNAFLLDWILGLFMGSPYGLRVVLSLAMIAPTGLVLGFPFPLGIRVLERVAPVLIPWGWAINGFLSVAGSLLAILLAMAIGFTQVLIVAGVIYGIGLALLPVASRQKAA